METLLTILIFGFIGWIVADLTKDRTPKKDYKWEMELMKMELNRGLSPAQEFHNQQNKWEIESRDAKYQFECAYAKWKQQTAQYQLMIEEVKSMPIIDKWQKHHKNWIAYVNNWNETANKDEKEWGFMKLDVFIATEIIPYKSYGLELVFKPFICQIEYVA